MADSYSKYGVPKISETKMPSGKKYNDGADAVQDAADPLGAGQRIKAAQPDLQGEFDAMRDFAHLCKAVQIRKDKGRLRAALEVGLKARNVGGNVKENRHGPRVRSNASYDNRTMSRNMNGSRDDGGKGRW
jgi:hypothetical protein